MSKYSHHLISRRGVVAGLGAAGAFAATPAFAQFSVDSLVKSAAPAAQALMLDEEDEIQLGKQYYPGYIAKGGGAYDDRNAQEALRKFAAPLMGTSKRDKFEWEITLVKNAQVNAWAIPGGKIAVNSALVQHSDDPAELASVIAHEVGHAELSHGVKQMRTKAFMNTLGAVGSAAIAAYGGQAGALAGQVVQALEGPVFQMINAGYSREHEFEADAHIMDVFKTTGYDPEKADDFFRTLQKIYPQNSSATTSLFSTHPGTQARIDKLEEKAKSMTSPAKKDNPPGWAELKGALPTPAGFTKG